VVLISYVTTVKLVREEALFVLNHEIRVERTETEIVGISWVGCPKHDRRTVRRCLMYGVLYFIHYIGWWVVN